MTEEVKKLYEQAPRFDESELYQSEEYAEASEMRLGLEALAERWFKGKLSTLLEDYADAMEQMTGLECMHYFEQGYLAGKQDGNKKTPETY